ncbi:prephenate dehydratase [Clostridium sediminicola]|uniref:prephenate dehydratase n=1 Tax=Clostridium sediminicola TaxID=3114879 RepID=UPI0031F22206
MSDLIEYRNEIDEIDKEIVKLFEKRMEVVINVAKYKLNNEIPILNSGRENIVIEKNKEYLNNNDLNDSLEEFFKNLMMVSRNYQSKKISSWKSKDVINYGMKEETINEVINGKINIVYQGVPGSFSSIALNEFFRQELDADNINKINVENFSDVFKALEDDKIQYGILPIENSSTGAVTATYDLLRNNDYYIVGERKIKVNHYLMGLKGSKLDDIKEVYSHPQALEQSKTFLNKYSDWKMIPYRNTATSAKFIKENNDITKAAIASIETKEIYDLDILASNINYNKNNYTRFVIIGKKLVQNKNNNKISVVLSVQHESGALFNALKVFWKNKLNMVKIESRPMINKPWEYFFYIDFEGNIQDDLVKKSMEELKKESHYFKVLGNYKADL